MQRFNHILFLQVFLLMLPLAALAAAGGYAWTLHQRDAARLADLQPRHARLEGMLQAQGDIEQLRQTVSDSLARFVHPADRPATEVGNEALQAIRGVMVEARLDVQSIQIQPPREGKTFDRIPVALRMEGELPALQAALARLGTQTPAVLVDSMVVNLAGPARPAASPRLSVQINLSVLKAKPA